MTHREFCTKKTTIVLFIERIMIDTHLLYSKDQLCNFGEKTTRQSVMH